MVSTPEEFSDNSSMPPRPYVTVKKTSARKSLYQFSEVLGVKKRTATRRLGAAKSKGKSNHTMHYVVVQYT